MKWELLPLFDVFFAFFDGISLKIFYSETTVPNVLKLGMIVPYGIVNKTTVGIFDSSKNMAAVTKNRTGGSKGTFSQISQNWSGLANFCLGRWFAQHDKIYLSVKFRENPLSEGKVIAPFWHFFCFFDVTSLKIFSCETAEPKSLKLGMIGP